MVENVLSGNVPPGYIWLWALFFNEQLEVYCDNHIWFVGASSFLPWRSAQTGFFPRTAMQFVRTLDALHFDLSRPLARVSDTTFLPPPPPAI